MVPFVDQERILLMRQYHYAADDVVWELPAGTLNGRMEDGRVLPTESPEACARRELLEETGYEAGEEGKVGGCFAMPGSSDELMHIFFCHRREGLSRRPFLSPRRCPDGAQAHAETAERQCPFRQAPCLHKPQNISERC